MLKKCCPKCDNTSFSACREVWICPYCSEDISNQPCCGINDEIIMNRTGDEDIVVRKVSSGKLVCTDLLPIKYQYL